MMMVKILNVSMNYSAILAAECERPHFLRVLSTAYASRMVARARSLTLSLSERRIPLANQDV